MRKTTPVLDRVLAKVSKTPGGCWEFMGARLDSGYGKISLTRCKPIFAHRAVFAAIKGPIPEGALVLHSCDNPPCCNPDHLFLGSAKDNWLDARRYTETQFLFGDKGQCRLFFGTHRCSWTGDSLHDKSKYGRRNKRRAIRKDSSVGYCDWIVDRCAYIPFGASQHSL